MLAEAHNLPSLAHLLQVKRKGCMQEVEELMRKQERLVQAAIKENEESESRVLKKNEERVE